MPLELSQNEVKILRDMVERTFIEYGSDSVVLYNPLQKLSPVSNVPNTVAGETPNDTPAHKKSKEDIAIHNKAVRWILGLEPFIGKSIKNPMSLTMGRGNSLGSLKND